MPLERYVYRKAACRDPDSAGELFLLTQPTRLYTSTPDIKVTFTLYLFKGRSSPKQRTVSALNNEDLPQKGQKSFKSISIMSKVCIFNLSVHNCVHGAPAVPGQCHHKCRGPPLRAGPERQRLRAGRSEGHRAAANEPLLPLTESAPPQQLWHGHRRGQGEPEGAGFSSSLEGQHMWTFALFHVRDMWMGL